MFEKIWLHVVGEMGKLIEVVEYLVKRKSETLLTGVRAVSYQLICLLGYSIGEKNKTHLAHSKTMFKRKSKLLSF